MDILPQEVGALAELALRVVEEQVSCHTQVRVPRAAKGVTAKKFLGILLITEAKEGNESIYFSVVLVLVRNCIKKHNCFHSFILCFTDIILGIICNHKFESG